MAPNDNGLGTLLPFPTPPKQKEFYRPMEHTQTQSRRPVILQVLPELRSGGVERGTIEVADAIAKDGMIPIVASAGGTMVQQLYNTGARHIILPLNRKNPVTIYKNIHRLVDIIKEHNVDIIHARSRGPAWSAYFAAKETGIPFVTTFHGTYNIGGRLKRFYNSIMTRGERVIAISEFVREHILRNYHCEENRLRLIHRGADLNQFSMEFIPPQRITQMAARLGVPSDVPIIMLPGRITRWKGQDVLLSALKHLRDNHPEQPFYCLLVGDNNKHNDYLKTLEKMIKTYGLEQHVKLTGNVSDMAAAYAVADIVVSNSLEPEAFGRVSVEAQAMGNLVIATAHGGSQETIIPGKTGWLVEPGNVTALAEALKTCLQLPEAEKNTIRHAAIAHAQEHFSTDTMCRKTLAVYREVLEAHQHSAQADATEQPLQEAA